MFASHRISVILSFFTLIYFTPAWLWSETGEHKSTTTCFETKRGLHATMSAKAGWFGDPKSESLTFVLMNDSDEDLESGEDSWTLVIDDLDVPDTGGQLWRFGPRSREGYGTLRSGQIFQFGKALPLAEYFPERRDYKVFWKAAGFRSNAIIVRGGTIPKS
jgi:hypothetical protein